MTNFAAQLKGEISRIAKRQSRAESVAIKKITAKHKADIAALKRGVAELLAMVRKLEKSQAKSTKQVVESEQGSQSLRFRVEGFAALRRRLELSAADMGKLIGVSGQTVYHWESGSSRPRASQLAAIAEVRKLSKRQAAERLAG